MNMSFANSRDFFAPPLQSEPRGSNSSFELVSTPSQSDIHGPRSKGPTTPGLSTDSLEFATPASTFEGVE
ncbi:hypothetical protein FRC10_004040 [Ceratobasidium sp. 414]|nr:hypothetical protein FRC10_004040 [Ceratobasidium sp. 414]